MSATAQTNENATLLFRRSGVSSVVSEVLQALYGSDEQTTVSNRTTRAVYENLSSDSTLPIAGCAAHCVVLGRQRCPKSNDSLVRISTNLSYSPIQWGGRGGMSTSCLNRSAQGSREMDRVGERGSRYLVRNPRRRVAHLWTGSDTECHMATTGGLAIYKYSSSDQLLETEKICHMCRVNSAKKTHISSHIKR